jgi:3-deoxy-D-manno-octulosonic-acid transferase
MILFFYNLALLVALVVGAPWWLWKMATADKYRDGLAQRLGQVPLNTGKGGDLLLDGRPVIWLHAVSVGEVIAVSRLVTELDRAFPHYQVLVSTTTRTGQELARTRLGGERVFYCPLDLPWAVRAYMNALKPTLFILAETEFWPNLLNGCFRRKIPVVVVNARVSDRSWPRYRRLRRLWKPLLSKLSVVLAQSETDAERLKAIGCLPERVQDAGNLKFDVRAAKEAEATLQLKTLTKNARFFVAGSTLDGEETALLETWPRLLKVVPQMVMVLAPRHPERFQAVADLLAKSGMVWAKRSDWRGKPAASLAPVVGGQIVLLNSIGELASVYSLAAIAFVGGSMVPAGGHNPLEPAQFGVPIVMGPNYENFRAITEDLLDHQALRISTREELAETILDLLRDRAAAETMGVRALEVFDQQSGATARCIEALKLLLPAEGEARQ